MQALVAGYVADLALGDPRRLHPVAGFGAFATWLERGLYRPTRASGCAHWVLATTGCVGLNLALGHLCARLGRLGSRLHAALSVWCVLGGRSLIDEGRAMQGLLESGELDLARKRLRALCGRDPDGLNATELARAAIESVAENTADAVTGPLFWAAVLGPAGAWLYRAANTLDAMVGHKSLRYERFGWCAARLDDALTWPAAQITALVCVVLAPAGRKHQVATAPLGSARMHPSTNAAKLEAAFAAACGVRLAGTNSYAGRSEWRASFDFGPSPTASDISPALSLSLACGLCFCAVSAAIARGLGR